MHWVLMMLGYNKNLFKFLFLFGDFRNKFKKLLIMFRHYSVIQSILLTYLRIFWNIISWSFSNKKYYLNPLRLLPLRHYTPFDEITFTSSPMWRCAVKNYIKSEKFWNTWKKPIIVLDFFSRIWAATLKKQVLFQVCRKLVTGIDSVRFFEAS